MSIKTLIKGDLVEIIDETVLKSFPLAELQKELESNLPKRTGILPINSIFFAQENSRKVYAFEAPSGLQNVEFIGIEYFISLPYRCYFLVLANDRVEHVYMLSSPDPITEEKDLLSLFYLPNMYTEGHFCTGRVALKQPICKKNLELFFEEFLRSGFNQDLVISREALLEIETNKVLESLESYTLISKDFKTYDNIKHNALIWLHQWYRDRYMSLYFEIWEKLSIKDNLLFKQYDYARYGRITFENMIGFLLKNMTPQYNLE